MKWFKIDGKEYRVRVFEPEESFAVLYGENTGRVLGNGAPMVLDPKGTFFNYTLTVGAMRGYELDFERLWAYLSIPRNEGVRLEFPRTSRQMWITDGEAGFDAYVSTGKRKIKKIIEDVDGELKDVVYDTFAINFIAMKAQEIPE